MTDLTILKKKLSTYRSDKNRLRKMPPDVLFEVLHAWECWPGTSKDFYVAIGVSQKQMAGVVGKAKKLKREGHFPAEEFKEVQVPSAGGELRVPGGGGCGIELAWDQGKLIRFCQVEQLVEFLKKTAA